MPLGKRSSKAEQGQTSVFKEQGKKASEIASIIKRSSKMVLNFLKDPVNYNMKRGNKKSPKKGKLLNAFNSFPANMNRAIVLLINPWFPDNGV